MGARLVDQGHLRPAAPLESVAQAGGKLESAGAAADDDNAMRAAPAGVVTGDRHRAIAFWWRGRLRDSAGSAESGVGLFFIQHRLLLVRLEFDFVLGRKRTLRIAG
jgi:hypothetical protein